MYVYICWRALPASNYPRPLCVLRSDDQGVSCARDRCGPHAAAAALRRRGCDELAQRRIQGAVELCRARWGRRRDRLD